MRSGDSALLARTVITPSFTSARPPETTQCIAVPSGRLRFEDSGHERRDEVDVLGQDAEFAQRAYRGDFLGVAFEDDAGGSDESEWKRCGHL